MLCKWTQLIDENFIEDIIVDSYRRLLAF